MPSSTLENIEQCLWHPCTQMKFHEQQAPLKIIRAQGPYLETADGKQIIDAISSWWCKSLGHGHPKLRQALVQQTEQFEHIMLANLTHQPITDLSAKLSRLLPGLNKVFYASDGSMAVEIAMKMSLHAHQLQGEFKRTRFMALANGYHGETILSLSVSDVGRFKAAYSALLLPCEFIQNLPYVSGKHDPLWHDCSAEWTNIEAQLNARADELTALICEPILQGAAGMLIYSKDLLRRLRAWCTAHNVHLIADEIMTGFGRTGLGLASAHADITPDFVCLGKGLTAGWLPLSAVLTSEPIYRLFYDADIGKAFLHSNTFAGNPLAAAVANAALAIYETERTYQQVQNQEALLYQLMREVMAVTQRLHNIRQIGAVVAADLIMDSPTAPTGREVFEQALALGALLRPLGNTLYWLPPLNTEPAVLKRLQEITISAIERAVWLKSAKTSAVNPA